MNIFYILILILVAAPSFGTGFASDYESIAAEMAIANSEAGPRYLPKRTIPIPTCEVSPQMQAMISAPYMLVFNFHPKTAQEWKEFVGQFTALAIADLPGLKEQFEVTVAPITIGEVKAFIVEPLSLPEKNKNRLLIHVHGGGYVFGPGEAGLREAILMAGIGGFKVLSIDYRMPPDFPYPAALDDAMAVWKEIVKTTDPKNMAIFGTSTGGALTLAMVLRAKEEHLPLPAAIASSTPWSDLTDTGDSYKTNEWVDNVLVSCNGFVYDAAKLYAGDFDMKDPYLSPVYGDYQGFPPTILTSGTRDLFLSNTSRVHRKLRRARVEAHLHVYEGQSHGQYLFDPSAPETNEVFTEIADFFDSHLKS